MPFDLQTLLRTLPFLLGGGQTGAVAEGYRRAQEKKQRDQQIAQQQAGQQQLQQAQMQNLEHDNARADQTAALARISDFYKVAPGLETQAAANATDPVAANLGLAKQLTGAAQAFGVDPSLGASFVPNMTEVVSTKKKKHAQDLIDRFDKEYGDQAAAAEQTVTLHSGEFAGMSIAKVRQLTQNAIPPAPAPVKTPTPGSFEEYVGAPPARQAQIESARKRYQQADDITPKATGSSSSVVAPSDTGPKLTPTQIDELATMDAVKAMATKAVALGDKTQWAGVGGLGRGTVSQFTAKNFGLGSPEGQELRNYIGQIKGTIAKLRGGTSFTPNEQRLLDTYTPGIDDDQMVIKAKVKSLFEFIDAKRAAFRPSTTEGDGWITMGNGVRVREKR